MKLKGEIRKELGRLAIASNGDESKLCLHPHQKGNSLAGAAFQQTPQARGYLDRQIVSLEDVSPSIRRNWMSSALTFEANAQLEPWRMLDRQPRKKESTLLAEKSQAFTRKPQNLSPATSIA